MGIRFNQIIALLLFFCMFCLEIKHPLSRNLTSWGTQQKNYFLACYRLIGIIFSVAWPSITKTLINDTSFNTFLCVYMQFIDVFSVFLLQYWLDPQKKITTQLKGILIHQDLSFELFFPRRSPTPSFYCHVNVISPDEFPRRIILSRLLCGSWSLEFFLTFNIVLLPLRFFVYKNKMCL